MTVFAYFRSIYRHREIVWSLVWRDFSTRYKQAVLGLGWALIYPCAMTLILWLAFDVLNPASKQPSDLAPILRFYSGLHPYNLFTSAIIYGTISVVANAGLVTKVKVPSETFPLSATLSALFDFAFGTIPFLLLLIWYRDQVSFSWNALWLLPTLGLELLLTLALVQLMAAACVIARDLRYGAPILCQLGLFLVPVIYTVEMIPQQYRTWYLCLNPMAVFVDSFRRATVMGLPPRLLPFLAAGSISIALFWISCRLFRNAQMKFADLV